jgi:hypothetical protein
MKRRGGRRKERKGGREETEEGEEGKEGANVPEGIISPKNSNNFSLFHAENSLKSLRANK